MSDAVLIGRFAPPQESERTLVTQALREADRAIVVMGSAFHARTPRDPLTWQERAECMRLSVPEAILRMREGPASATPGPFRL